MNRYPLWKYLLILVAFVFAVIYASPNFFGEAPAIQILPAKPNQQISIDLQALVEKALKDEGITVDKIEFQDSHLVVHFLDTNTQIKARDILEKSLNSNTQARPYIIALNLVPRTPSWLQSLSAKPMYLGLDLRGGVHFLLQVDVAGILNKRLDAIVGSLRRDLRESSIRYTRVAKQDQSIVVRFANTEQQSLALQLINNDYLDLQTQQSEVEGQPQLLLTVTPEAILREQEQALKQNIQTLQNRVNELGVAEPVIQQQGIDRIVVQLPGIQDTAKAKDIIGRTATLQMRLVDESPAARAATFGGRVPLGSERFPQASGGNIVLQSEVLVTGDNLTDAQAGLDQQTNEPIVLLTMDTPGGRIIRETSIQNLQKRMAIILFEKGQGVVLTAPVIRGELGTRFQISGSMTTEEANDLALLFRAGALAAPMEIIEERTVGPSLGAENIERGMNSVLWGFVAVILFMCIYYLLFGVFSSLALGFNLTLLVALLSTLQATLTLPGMAAMALVLGMAIDSNVLINERIREELRKGAAPQAAIKVGYENAWATILDSNVTTLIAGLALLAYGSGPVRGFAVVHCLGILTSMFSSVFFCRGLVNLWYGSRPRLQKLSIGTIWKPKDTVSRS